MPALREQFHSHRTPHQGDARGWHPLPLPKGKLQAAWKTLFSEVEPECPSSECLQGENLLRVSGLAVYPFLGLWVKIYVCALFAVLNDLSDYSLS